MLLAEIKISWFFSECSFPLPLVMSGLIMCLPASAGLLPSTPPHCLYQHHQATDLNLIAVSTLPIPPPPTSQASSLPISWWRMAVTWSSLGSTLLHKPPLSGNKSNSCSISRTHLCRSHIHPHTTVLYSIAAAFQSGSLFHSV